VYVPGALNEGVIAPVEELIDKVAGEAVYVPPEKFPTPPLNDTVRVPVLDVQNGCPE
jgi:hypothetical protein